MRTAWPAARPSHSVPEFRAHSLDMLPPRLIFLHRDGPADPLVARERCDVFPRCQCIRIGRERLSEVSRNLVYDSSGDSNGCHKVISQAKGPSISYEDTTRIPGLSPPIQSIGPITIPDCLTPRRISLCNRDFQILFPFRLPPPDNLHRSKGSKMSFPEFCPNSPLMLSKQGDRK